MSHISAVEFKMVVKFRTITNSELKKMAEEVTMSYF
jgi:hypothetical protein